jgi:hypothetical protein
VVGLTAGERVGATVALGDGVSAGVETGNANVGAGDGDGVPDAVGEGVEKIFLVIAAAALIQCALKLKSFTKGMAS